MRQILSRMKELLERMRELTDEALFDTPYFLVDFIVNEAQTKIKILLDGEEGIPIDVCSRVSRKISRTIDEEELGDEEHPFIMEVSSPGIDHPLKLRKQYPQHMGRLLDIKTVDQNIEGKLIKLSDDGLEVQLVKKKKKEPTVVKQFTWEQMLEVKVIPSFK